MTNVPKPTELAAKWREVAQQHRAFDSFEIAETQEDCADELEASLADHPVVEVAALTYNHLGQETCMVCGYWIKAGHGMALGRPCPVGAVGAATEGAGR